jgi:uncharacterized protein (PEP-CTERM system associated)
MGALVAFAASAQQGTGFTPTFTASTSYTDVKGQITGERDSQFITQISPGFRWVRNGGRVQGAVDYTLNAKFYSKQDEADARQNSLAATIRVEAIENWLYADALASIAQEAISPFGSPVSQSLSVNENATEVRRFSVSPYARGRVFGAATYEVRWKLVRARGSRDVASNSDLDSKLISLGSANETKLGWGLVASRQKVDFGSGANSTSDRLNLQGSWAVLPELRLGLTGGSESTDVVGGTRRTYDNWGWTAQWTPTPRTDLSVLSEHRYFGNAHNVRFTHRMRRSTWIYTDTRGSSSGGDSAGAGQPVSLYSLYFNLFAAQEPDPVVRDQLVRAFLLAIGQDPGALVSGGFLTSEVTLQRRQDLALAIQGVRSSVSLQAYRSETRTLQETGSLLSTAPIDQVGYTVSFSYRLTPSSSMSLVGSRQRTASSGTLPESDLQSASISLSSVLGRYASTSFALRYSDFNSVSNPYREAAVTASLTVRF